MIPSNSMVFLTDDDALVPRCVSRLLRSAGRRLLDLLTPHEFEVMQLVVTGMLMTDCWRARRCGKDHQGPPRSRNEKTGHRVGR